MVKKKRICVCLTVMAIVAMLWMSIEAQARPWRVDQIPNAFSVPNVNNDACLTCHIGFGGGPRNSFGMSVEALVTPGSTAPFWSSNLASQDSDGDGATNGLELQDPAGAWDPGDPAPGNPALVSHPGDPSSVPPAVSTATPTHTPVIAPTAPPTATPTHTPSFTATATPEPTATPVPTVEDTATPEEPTATLEATATPEIPTNTPQPTVTPEGPTPTPTVTPEDLPQTPTPTAAPAEPSPTSTPTVTAVPTLTPQPTELSLDVDIQPGSCPNIILINRRGLLQVAILGSADLDVTTINPDTVRLFSGIPPVEMHYADIGSPFTEPRNDCGDCIQGAPDGHTDLVMKFNTVLVTAAILQEYNIIVLSSKKRHHFPGVILLNLKDCVRVPVSARFYDSFGGTLLTGHDTVLLRLDWKLALAWLHKHRGKKMDHYFHDLWWDEFLR